MRRLILIAIRIYQWTLSPLLGGSCRFHPTCSCYTAEAVERFGAWQGSWLGLKRIARCHAWNPGGYDPVPKAPAAVLDTTRSLPDG
jgi:putative membrane protein insertion efficiency factor